MADIPLLFKFIYVFWCCFTIDPDDTTAFVRDYKLPYELEALPLKAPAIMSFVAFCEVSV